jgi:cytochrome c oxidase assembly protein subunit 15
MQSSSRSRNRPVALWIYTGVFMLLIQVILGGITRLTGSGLSITEWDVVTGALPPLNQAQWLQAYDKYRLTPQFRLLNFGFDLADFKFIFFWEWFHRFWARLVGVVFLVGFVWLLAKRRLEPRMVRPLIILFLLGGLQGAVGWVMVASGLTGDAIYVQPTKLALHFIFALGLIVYTFWFALELSVPDEARAGFLPAVPRSSDPSGNLRQPGTLRQLGTLRGWTIGIILLLVVQLLYGALMAGHKAANVAPTWPRINGSWIPESSWSRPLLHDLIGNRLTVQFMHRTLAYLLFAGVLVWTVIALRLPAVPGFFRRLRWLPLGLITVQIVLGICSLLTSPGIVPGQWGAFDWLAQTHQVTGLLFLLTMVGMLYFVVPIRRSVTV